MLIFGEPGLEKSNIAALVHFGGPSRGLGPMAALDCAALDGAELFGRGDKAGLLELVGKGTLLLKNVHKVCVWEGLAVGRRSGRSHLVRQRRLCLGEHQGGLRGALGGRHRAAVVCGCCGVF